MDHSVKIAAACGVLLSGTVVALLFRHESPRAGPRFSEGGDRLVLRKQLPSAPDPRTGSEALRGRFDLSGSTPAAPRPPDQGATILRPIDAAEPPPPLARDYPGTGVRGSPAWGTSIGLPVPSNAARPDESVRTHKIVDGDALGGLAERYLGSADRYLEIYEANRDVLSSPQILPIGVELRIPPSRSPTRPSSDTTAERRLVPVPREADQPVGSKR